jgi:hypothetical protein
MARHIPTTARWTVALCGFLLSPVALAAFVFVAYFVLDGARVLGGPGSFAIIAIVVATALLLRHRRARPARI